MRACAPHRLCWLSGILSAICFTWNRLKSHFISRLLELISAATLCRVAVGQKAATVDNLTTVHCYCSLLEIRAELTDAEVQATKSSTRTDSGDAKPDASAAAYPQGTRSSQSVRSLRSAERPVNEESLTEAKYLRYYKTITIVANPCTVLHLILSLEPRLESRMQSTRRRQQKPRSGGIH
jgi:hypothetical protein